MIPGEYKNASATLTDENNISIHALGIMATWENRKSSRAEIPPLASSFAGSMAEPEVYLEGYWQF